ncbi:MAG: cellulose binding domain-containing protein [Kineosporiaceae bacterium]
MSPLSETALSRSRRAAATLAVTATVLAALAATGIAAVAATEAAAPSGSTGAQAASAADVQVASAPLSTGAVTPAVVRPAAAPATTPGTPTTRCTVTPWPTYAPGTVVQSQGFETEPAWDWSPEGATQLQVTNAAARTGRGGLRAAPVGMSDRAVWSLGAIRTPGTYTVSLAVRVSPWEVSPTRTPSPSTSSGVVGLSVVDPGTGATVLERTAYVTTSWTVVTFAVTPPVRPASGTCVPSGSYAVPLLVKLRTLPVPCGTGVVSRLDVDDASLRYDGTDVTPSASTQAKGVVRPLCTQLPTTTTSPPPSTGACKVKVTTPLTWKGGVQLAVAVTNQKAALSNWTLSAVLPDGATLAAGWPGRWSQSGGQASVVFDGDYANPLAARSQARVGLVLDGTSKVPSRWYVNGVLCRS